MFDWIGRIFEGRSTLDIARDLLDLFIVSYVVYRLLLMVRGTRAMQVGMGLGVVFLLYLVAKSLQLVTLLSLLQYALSSVILIVVVVFQNDIRRALIRVGGRAWFGGRRKQEQTRVIDEVVAAVTELARHRIGAIIAFEQDANLGDFTQREGVVINAAVTRELLVAIFYPEAVNKLHDGAVIIRDLKIARAGVFFPMPESKGTLDRSLGTRHQAALGITEETDAVVVVVSEERGTISFCFNGNIAQNIDGTALRQTLAGLLENRPPKAAAQPPRATLTPAPPAARPSLAPASTPSPPSSGSPTASPLPKARSDRSKIPEPPRSVEEPVVHAKHASVPMRKTTKSVLPPVPGAPPAEGEEAPSSERSTFVNQPRVEDP
jgi:uncharacterized protein (TIGR00159 family)